MSQKTSKCSFQNKNILVPQKFQADWFNVWGSTDHEAEAEFKYKDYGKIFGL